MKLILRQYMKLILRQYIRDNKDILIRINIIIQLIASNVPEIFEFSPTIIN